MIFRIHCVVRVLVKLTLTINLFIGLPLTTEMFIIASQESSANQTESKKNTKWVSVSLISCWVNIFKVAHFMLIFVLLSEKWVLSWHGENNWMDIKIIRGKNSAYNIKPKRVRWNFQLIRVFCRVYVDLEIASQRFRL